MLFNNENEPDLGPVDWGGGRSSEVDDPDYNWDIDPKPLPQHKVPYTFYSEEELVTSQFFQRALTKCLMHKDLVIRSLQEELLKAYAK